MSEALFHTLDFFVTLRHVGASPSFFLLVWAGGVGTLEALSTAHWKYAVSTFASWLHDNVSQLQNDVTFLLKCNALLRR